MLEVRRDADIFRTDGGWFRARWHFSFDHYRDPEQMGIGALRVFNDDILIAGANWPMHPHRDVEGITYIPSGTFRHADSLGNGGILHRGAVQRMTLGSGALHSESNASETDEVRFLQFWILPDTPSLPPSNEQRQFDADVDFLDQLRCVVAPADGHARTGSEPTDVGAVEVHQDARVFIGNLSVGARAERPFAADRAGYLYLIEGSLRLREHELTTGDAVKIHGPDVIELVANERSHVILIEIPEAFTPVGVWAR
jgi:redox-sensitive bicupin YhaK (pirin superfamily)